MSVPNSESSAEDIDVERELELIGDMWGTSVHVKYHTEYDEWMISNSTDEGLPTRVETKVAYGDTLEEAIEKVKQGDFKREH